MPVTLSVKNVPDAVARRLRARAKRNHRSLQGELLAIVEAASESSRHHKDGGGDSPAAGTEGSARISPQDVLALVRCLGLATPSEAAEAIRQTRDGLLPHATSAR